MLSRATWRDSEKSSTLRSKSVLSLMQNWAAASLMVSCGKRTASVNSCSFYCFTPSPREAHPKDACFNQYPDTS